MDEKTAETAIAAISVTFERLPFVLDPLDSLAEGGGNAYPGDTNTFVFRQGFATEKWTADQVASFRAGNEPTAEPQQTVEYGDLEAAFAESTYVYEGTFTNAGSCFNYDKSFALIYVFIQSKLNSLLLLGANLLIWKVFRILKAHAKLLVLIVRFL